MHYVWFCQFDYIVWTGDLPAHYVWLSSQNDTAFLMQYITDMFLKYFPHTPVYSTLGNHEGVPVNRCAFHCSHALLFIALTYVQGMYRVGVHVCV